jgi:hypothetical protein
MIGYLQSFFSRLVTSGLVVYFIYLITVAPSGALGIRETLRFTSVS